MGWFGTIIGSSLGFVLGGPLGAIGGAALGHILIDRSGKSLNENLNRGRIHIHEKRQTGYFLALFSIMGKIAIADGQISANERRLVQRFITQSGMDQTQGGYALRIFEEAAQSPHSVSALANQFYRITAGQSKYHLNFMDLLVRLATADGVLTTNEDRLLQEVASELYINDKDLQLLMSRATYSQQHHSSDSRGHGVATGGGGVDRAYHILGCTPQSNDSEIRSAYRRLAAAYHPDKIISKNLPEEFMQLAKEKFQEIQAAYQTIKQTRKMQ